MLSAFENRVKSVLPALARAQQCLLRLFQLLMKYHGALVTFNIFNANTLPASLYVFFLSV
jgi:hypothetical protein